MQDKFEEIFLKIRNECINMIYAKKVDLEELSFKIGCDERTLLDFLKNRNQDFSIYLKMYSLLLEW